MAVAKDQIRQIITENNITSVADVYALAYGEGLLGCAADGARNGRKQQDKAFHGMVVLVSAV